MSAQILQRDLDQVTIEVRISLTGSLLQMEEQIQETLNEAGSLATTEALSRFDTDGSPIQIGNVRFTSKGQEPKHYQTPYGQVTVPRHVYQNAQGGKTFCPLERDARIIVASTPRFAKQVAHKYAETSGAAVVRDLEENHGRHVTRKFIQDITQAVASIAQAKEESWTYEVPKLDGVVKTVSIGLDGTCVLFSEDGYRQAMVGTISLYDSLGERLHTIYVGASPEYGKAKFLARMEREVERIKTNYPDAYRLGLADGASDNWTFLKRHTQGQLIDFYHASEYLGDVAKVLWPKNLAQRELWMEEHCHQLKHKQGAASRQLKEMRSLLERKWSQSKQDTLQKAITYFENHHHQMNYAKHQKAHHPIGSGVTEAACKVLVKQRLCRSGMKWKAEGSRIVLSLRSLVLTADRWNQFWKKVDQYGLNMAL